MALEDEWRSILETDVRFGYVDRATPTTHQLNPQVVLNSDSSSMLRVLREELRHSDAFAFSVAFVSPRAVALLKQEFVDFAGRGVIVTSDYLGFNSPRAFAELLNLRQLGIDVRLHNQTAYHPKGYVFGYQDRVTAVLGSSNLTENALARNYEWNLKVSASRGSDLADQLADAIDRQMLESVPLTQAWLDEYARRYVRPSAPVPAHGEPARTARIDVVRDIPSITVADFGHHLSDRDPQPNPSVIPEPAASTSAVRHAMKAALLPATDDYAQPESDTSPGLIANAMQADALAAIAALRGAGKRKALVISATGTGKTILSALDVQAAAPDRLLFIVHREQILDRAIEEYKRVLGAPERDFGKLTGSAKQSDRKYVFATVQTLSQEAVLQELDPEMFDYILIDEVHRVGAESYRRVIEHFKPSFLLGMTATPERPDGFNVFELFDFNVPYEIRLGRALESDMLSPFHYYGIADVSFDDGTTTAVETSVNNLASRVRVQHVLRALERYGQAGVQPRGLIFCSRKEEARALSAALNEEVFRGQALRTVALTGEDSISFREAQVARLEAGELDYILTVDIFNEGVDIPSINQVVMLRQTESSIVFVQQLGRGLRKVDEKEYLVVLDFIGNYANNYLIPVALFGDESLNKESLRKSLIAAEESGVLPGLSSVRFDRISQQRVLDAISRAKLDSLANLRYSIEMLQNRLGRVPRLQDFMRFESTDPVLLATRMGNYPSLVEKVLGVDSGLNGIERDALTLVSCEALDAKRPHELLLLRDVLAAESVSYEQFAESLRRLGAPATSAHIHSAARSLTLDFYTDTERARYGKPLVHDTGTEIRPMPELIRAYRSSEAFRVEVDDLIDTGLALIEQRYSPGQAFTAGRQYTRKDSCRLLLWPKNVMSTIYGYKVDYATGTCPIFVTHHKADHVSASTAYDDELLDRRTMRWYTRSRRTLQSREVAAIVKKEVDTHVFAKKDDADGASFYYLGSSTPTEAVQTTMKDDEGKDVSVVRMLLHFDRPIDTGVFDYFHPAITD